MNHIVDDLHDGHEDESRDAEVDSGTKVGAALSVVGIVYSTLGRGVCIAERPLRG